MMRRARTHVDVVGKVGSIVGSRDVKVACDASLHGGVLFFFSCACVCVCVYVCVCARVRNMLRAFDAGCSLFFFFWAKNAKAPEKLLTG